MQRVHGHGKIPKTGCKDMKFEKAREGPRAGCGAHVLPGTRYHNAHKPLQQIISQWILFRLWWNFLPCSFKMGTWLQASPIVGFIKGSSQISISQPWMDGEALQGALWTFEAWVWEGSFPNWKNYSWGFGSSDIIEVLVHFPKVPVEALGTRVCCNQGRWIRSHILEPAKRLSTIFSIRAEALIQWLNVIIIIIIASI